MEACGPVFALFNDGNHPSNRAASAWSDTRSPSPKDSIRGNVSKDDYEKELTEIQYPASTQRLGREIFTTPEGGSCLSDAGRWAAPLARPPARSLTRGGSNEAGGLKLGGTQTPGQVAQQGKTHPPPLPPSLLTHPTPLPKTRTRRSRKHDGSGTKKCCKGARAHRMSHTLKAPAAHSWKRNDTFTYIHTPDAGGGLSGNITLTAQVVAINLHPSQTVSP